MDHRRGARVDAVLYAASGAFALAGALTWENPLQRAWGRTASAAYLLAAAAAWWVAWRAGGAGDGGYRAWRRRVILLVAVVAGAAVLPLAVEVTLRTRPGPLAHAQSETLVVEQGARALLDGADPYAVLLGGDDLRTWPVEIRDHLPYLPGMLAFGLPRALGRAHPWTDARVWWALSAVVATGWALRRTARPEGRVRAVQVLVAIPTGALAMAGGGDDVAVLALMLAGAAATGRRRPVAAGLLCGAAAAMKLTAWPLVPLLALAVRDRSDRPAGVRFLAATGAVVVPVVVPFLAWDPSAMLEDVLGYPLTGALAGPGVGVVGDLLGTPWSFAVLAVAVALGGTTVLRRFPLDVPAALRWASVATLAAIVCVPGARFGLLAYPVNLAVWSVALRPQEEVDLVDRGTGPAGAPGAGVSRTADR